MANFEVVKQENGVQVVRLSFTHGYANSFSALGIQELYAEYATSAATLTFLSSAQEPRQIVLTSAQLDALCTSWQAYKSDDTAAALEKAENETFQELVEEQRDRAREVGAVLSEVSGYPYLFTLEWPLYHPFSRFNNFWQYGNGPINLASVKERLTVVEESYNTFQEGVSLTNSSIQQMQNLAHLVGIELHYSTRDGKYSFYIELPHPFYDFWQTESGMNQGTALFRLNQMHSILSKNGWLDREKSK